MENHLFKTPCMCLAKVSGELVNPNDMRVSCYRPNGVNEGGLMLQPGSNYRQKGKSTSKVNRAEPCGIGDSIKAVLHPW